MHSLGSTTTPDLDLAIRLFRELHDESIDGPGVTRDAYGPGEQRAHDRIAAEGERLGLEVAVDPVGNLLLTLPGHDRAAKRILIGSHLDTVRCGGDYDGTVGVLAALACVSGVKQSGFQPVRDLTVIVTRAEEAGEWFPVSFPGSRAALGTLPTEALGVRRTDTGRTLADHMRDAGFRPEAVCQGQGWLGPGNVECFLEMHIEQGPVLDAGDIPIAVITSIPGTRRYRMGRIVGETNHSGATPRLFRRDAALAASELVCCVDDLWEQLEADGHQLVATCCVLRTMDAGFTRIAGAAEFELDIRSSSEATLDLYDTALRARAATIAVRRNVAIDLGPPSASLPRQLDLKIQDALHQHASDASIPCIRMTSGGGHDVAAFAAAGIPAGLLFVRNQNGSHSPRETIRMSDFEAACVVVSRWLLTGA